MKGRSQIPTFQKYGPGGKYARVHLNGKDVPLGRHDDPESFAKYERLIAEWLLNGRKEVPSVAGKTVRDVARAYLTWAQGQYTKRTRKTNHFDLVKRVMIDLDTHSGQVAADEFGMSRLKSLRDQWIKSGRLNRETINSHVGIVARAFRWGAEEEMVSPSVWHALKALSPLKRGKVRTVREPGKVEPVPPEHVQAVLDTCKPVVGDMIRLQVLTGMRPNEVAGLCREEIDEASWKVTIPDARNKSAHHGRARVVFVGPQARAILEKYLDRTGPLFIMFGRPMTAVRYFHQIQFACKRAKIPYWAPNRLRHNFGTTARKRFGVEGARTTLGHSETSTTEIYAEKDEDLARRVVEEIG